MYKINFGKLLFVLGLTIFIMGCGVTANINPTPTPTDSGLSIANSTSPCSNLSGELEMQVLVGPAEVVGLEPIAVGNIPFTVTWEGGTHVIKGSGTIAYQDVLEQEWGSYTVEFDLQGDILGICEENGALNMVVTTTGSQLVEVRAEGFQGDYPWTGSHEFALVFPIEEGAIAEGEGWIFLLHLN